MATKNGWSLQNIGRIGAKETQQFWRAKVGERAGEPSACFPGRRRCPWGATAPRGWPAIRLSGCCSSSPSLPPSRGNGRGLFSCDGVGDSGRRRPPAGWRAVGNTDLPMGRWGLRRRPELPSGASPAGTLFIWQVGLTVLLPGDSVSFGNCIPHRNSYLPRKQASVCYSWTHCQSISKIVK